jgi:proteic killer suppression protein
MIHPAFARNREGGASTLPKYGDAHSAAQVEDMRMPPGNNLEKLKGDRQGQYSVRINDQYRICFTWENGDAHAVEIVDYH